MTGAATKTMTEPMSTDPHTPTAVIGACAENLHEARRSGRAIPQLTATTSLTLDDAYAVQAAGVRLRMSAGERVVGAKLGLTSKAKAEQMGVADVIIGVLTDAMHVPDGGLLDISRGVHPRIEPEVAFRLGRAVDTSAPDADLRGAVDAVAPALEIIDSRYQDFRFTLEDVVADNTSGSHFVIGPWTELGEGSATQLLDRAVEMRVDGRVCATGSTTDILDDPWQALPTPARLAARYGHVLPAGAVLLAGAATAAVPLPAGARVTAEVAGLGTVSVSTAPGAETAEMTAEPGQAHTHD